jgi:pimeloyl-ACP methyl ester carboxylesterase
MLPDYILRMHMYILRPPNSDLYTDSDHIRSYVESLADAGHRLVVLMHSYGGQVGTNALAGLDTNTRKESDLPGGVVRLVYMCAHALAEGTSMFGLAKAAGREQFLLDAFIIADDGTVEYREVRERMIGPGLSEEELESYVARLRPWNGQGVYQEIQAVAWMDIPVSYILTLQDRLMPLAYQNAMVAGIRAAGRETFELETGHCAHATMTGKVVEILHTVASREGKEQ